MADTVIAPRYQMRYEQLVNTPVLDRIPYFHDREIEYILEVSKAEQENVALRAKVAKLKAPISDEEWDDCCTLPAAQVAWRHEIDALIAARGREGESEVQP